MEDFNEKHVRHFNIEDHNKTFQGFVALSGWVSLLVFFILAYLWFFVF